jgi:hypothetical protein
MRAGFIVTPAGLKYGRTHQEPLLRDPEEMFHFVWENRRRLSSHSEAFTRVTSVRPALRIAPDGFALRETIAELFAFPLTAR